MAGSLQGYKNSLLAGMGNEKAQQAMMNETPGFNMFANTNQTNMPGMDILNPTERRNQEYDSNAMRAEALNKEVEIGLGSRIDPVMSDSDKQNYLNSLTKNQYNQMLKYKNEGYGFMASKELLENSYKLADPNATGLMKYKDYADKDAYYYNNANNGVSDFIDRYISNPIGKVAKWRNEDLGFAEDAQNGNMNFADRFANLTLGNIINGLDTAAKGVSGIVDESESKVKTLYDKVVKGYDTDWDFYDKDREETIVDKIIDTAYGAGQGALGVVGLVPGALPITAALSTEPGEKIGGLTIGTISKLVDETLSLPGIRAGYNLLSDDSKDKVSTGLAMIITGKAAKAGGAKINAKAEPYIRATKEMVQNGLNKGAEYAKVQADFENFSKTKGWTEREDGTFVETENYNPGYRGRVAKEFWEGFKEGVKEKFNNPNGTNLSERGSTPYQEGLQGGEIPTGGENVNKTNANNTQSNGIVNTIGASQLRQWNKMNKVQGIKFANRYGTDYGTWMAQRGFNQSYDNNINQLIDYDKYMQNQKRQALGAITQRYREPAVDDMLLEAINRAEYIKSDDLGKLQNLALKNEQGGLTPADIDYVRQRFGYNFPLRFDGTDIAGTTQRNNNMYMRVKDVLERIADENGIPQLRDINREIAATHHIIEGTTRYYNGIATNDIVSLKDLITLAGTVANPSARPLFVIQQSLKMPKVRDAILGKLIKGKTTEERNQIKIDFDKIRKIQNEAEQRRMLEEWIAKWNLKVEEATKAMQNRLPENITQGGVSAGDRGFMATYGDGPTYQELGLGNIRETASPQFLLRAIIEQLKESNLIKDINTSEAINQILANLSPEAQAKLAQIANKLANGRELTPEEGKVVEKLADIIRQDQDTITDVQQPGLFDGVYQNNKNILYHVTKNNNLTKFEDLNKLREYKSKIEEADEKIKNAPSSLSKEYQDAWQEKMDLIKNMPEGMDVLEQIGQNGSRGGEGIYLTSRPYEWSMTLRDQGIDLGDNVYAIYLPEGVEEYMQTAGNDILLPEAIVDGTKAVVLGKVDIEKGDIEYQANQLLKEYTKNKGGLDNGEPTDINNTNLPTNPTNNGGSTEGGNPGEGGLGELSGGETTGKAKANDGANGGGDKGGSGEGVNQLGTPKSTDGVGEEIIEIGDVNDAYQLIDNLLGNSKYSLSSPSERGGYRTFTNSNRDAAISIDSDGNIVEFVQSENAPKGAADELLLHAIEQGANKIDVDYNSVGLISKLRMFGFYPLSKAGWGDGKKYYLAHNGDAIDTIRQNIGGYNIDERLSHIKWFNTYREAAEYRNEFIKDNTGYKLTDEEGWDGLNNYKEFNKNFKTQTDIKKYIDDTFKGVDSHVSNDIEDLFNKSLAMARQAYDGNKNTQDLSIIYALLSELPEDVLGRYWRPTNTLTFGKEGFTPYHELTHYSDYFLGKELTGSEVKLSTIANQIKNRKRPKNIDTRAELIWDFAEIFKEIDKWAWHGEDVSSDKGYTEYAWEILARRGEAFYSDIQGKGLVSMDGEMFPRKISTMYAKWLGKVNIARAKGELYDGTLQEISDLVRRKVVLSIPGVGNVRGMKVGILKDGKTVGIKDVELSENSDRRGYHGSPASFDKFDSSHMGEGEGAQAHGWGHYIAVREGTAENYAKLKERRYGTYDFTIDGKPYREVYDTLSPEQKDIFDTFKAVKVNDRSFEESWDYIENKKDTRQYDLAKKILSEIPEKRAAHPEKPKEYYDMMEEDVRSYIDSYEKYEKDVQSLRDRVGTSSNLYDVEIPDPIKKDTPTGSNYLEEEGEITTDQAYDIFQRIYDKQNEGLKPIKDATLDDVRKIGEVMQKDYKYTDDIADRFVEGVSERLEGGYEIKEAIRDELSWYGSMASKHDAWLRDAGLYQEMERTGRFDKFSMAQIKNGGQLYNYLSHFLGGPKSASMALNDIGYDGIHYFGNRDGEAYVIFNDDAIDIKSHKTL